MPSDPSPNSPSSVTNEALRLILSPQEQAFIERRITKAKRQLLWGVVIPVGYFSGLYLWANLGITFADIHQFVAFAFVSAFFVAFAMSLHFLLAGSVDWVMFTRYRRNHRAFLNRYHRSK